MIKSAKPFVTALLIFLSVALPSPDHCYDFAHTTVNDLCGEYHLTRQGNHQLYLVGNMGTPLCNLGGCSF